jgi:erythromycin esterase-like protein
VSLAANIVCPLVTFVALDAWRLNVGLLQVEEFALEVEAAAISAERAARRDYAVTGNDDGDGISIVSHADGAAG